MIRCLFGTVLVGLGVISTIGWQYFTDCGKANPVSPAPAATPAGSLPQWVEGIGYVEPRSEVRRLTFKTGGVIARCRATAGDHVRKGESVAELDDATARTVIDVAKRKLELARARLTEVKAGEHPHLILLCEQSVERLREHARHLRAEAARAEKSFAKGGNSEADRNEAMTRATQAETALKEKEAELLYLRNKVRAERVAVAESEVRFAEAEVAAAEQRLVDTRLLAPFDGVVLKYLKREGEGVSPLMPPEPVVAFADLTRVRIRAEVDERYARHVVVGQLVEVYGRNVEGSVYAGRVAEVESAMGDKTLFSRSPAERKELDVRQVVVEMGTDFTAPVGLQVDVRVQRK